MRAYLAVLFGVAMAQSYVGYADEPLPPPETQTMCSPSKRFCATADLQQDVTVIHAVGATMPLWTIPGWHRLVHVSDDGLAAVVEYEGMNLVPPDVALTEPMLRFYRQGRQVRVVTLGGLYRSKSYLRRTISHYAWRHADGFNEAGQFFVELVGGSRFPFMGKRIAFSSIDGSVEPLIVDGAH